MYRPENKYFYVVARDILAVALHNKPRPFLRSVQFLVIVSNGPQIATAITNAGNEASDFSY